MELRLVPFRPVDFISDVVCNIDVAEFDHELTLNMHYSMTGDLRKINWPDETDTERALWRNTCFEYFVGATGSRRYYEFNQSPNGRHACYAFDDYRSGMKTSDEMTADQFSVTKNDLVCQLKLAVSNPVFATGPIHLGLSIVVRDRESKLHYFALSHPSEPDFHDRQHHRIIDLSLLRGE